MAHDEALRGLKQTKADTYQTCARCGRSILKGEICYRAYRESSHALIPRHLYCVSCFSTQSTALLHLRFNRTKVPKPS